MKAIIGSILLALLFISLIGVGAAQADVCKEFSRIKEVVHNDNLDSYIIRMDLKTPTTVWVYDNQGGLLDKSPLLCPKENSLWLVSSKMGSSIVLRDEEGIVVDSEKVSEILREDTYFGSTVFFLDIYMFKFEFLGDGTVVMNPANEGIFNAVCRIPGNFTNPEVVKVVNNSGNVTVTIESVSPGATYTREDVGDVNVGDYMCIIVLDNGEVKSVDKAEVGSSTWGLFPRKIVDVGSSEIKAFIASAVRIN